MTHEELWKNNVLTVVKYLGDKELQKKLWFGETAYIFCPDELYCKLFDDDDIEIFLDKNIGNLTEHQLKLGFKLVNEMELYDKGKPDSLDPKLVINDPEWDKVIVAAQNFYQAFDVHERPQD